jgi:hypothetical protein
MFAKYKVSPPVLPGALVNARDMLTRKCGTVCLFHDCDSKKRDNTISRDAYHDKLNDQKSRRLSSDKLTLVDACRSRRNQASDPLHGGLVFDAPVVLQNSGTLYKAVAEHKIASSDLCHSSVVTDAVILTGQGCNHLALWCGPHGHSASRIR